MDKVGKIIKYQLFDIFRNKWLLFYALFFFVVTDGLFRFGGGGAKVIISFMNIMLFIIPLVSILFGTMFLYNSREYIELLLTQPVKRRVLFAGLYLGLALPLVAGFVLGVSIPFALYDDGGQLATLGLLLLSGTFLTLMFTALAFFIALRNEDRARGFGISILVWLIFSFVYDGIILFASFSLADYPIEKPLIAASMLNPIDLARILILLKTDFSALMGYTGAVFQNFFGSSLGITVSLLTMLVWTMIPAILGTRTFEKKDF